jgi:predicted RNase H-like HicB family nuclease
MPNPRRIVRVQATLPWQCSFGKSGNWVAVCDPLKLTVQSGTWSELVEDIADALDLMFKDLLETGELTPFLRERGWTLIGPVPRAPKNVRFDVPFIPIPVSVPCGAQANVY